MQRQTHSLVQTIQELLLLLVFAHHIRHLLPKIMNDIRMNLHVGHAVNIPTAVRLAQLVNTRLLLSRFAISSRVH